MKGFCISYACCCWDKATSGVGTEAQGSPVQSTMVGRSWWQKLAAAVMSTVKEKKTACAQLASSFSYPRAPPMAWVCQHWVWVFPPQPRLAQRHVSEVILDLSIDYNCGRSNQTSSVWCIVLFNCSAFKTNPYLWSAPRSWELKIWKR